MCPMKRNADKRADKHTEPDDVARCSCSPDAWRFDDGSDRQPAFAVSGLPRRNRHLGAGNAHRPGGLHERRSCRQILRRCRNWDLIPPSAISTTQIVTGNPVFGLNALAGAVVMQMKNGFNWQGTEMDLQGGMDYTAQGSAQYGVNKGDWAYYVDIDGVRTNGFRYFGQSDAARAYGDIGYRAWNSEIHLSMTGGADGLGVAGTTPMELAQQNPWAVFTTPQTTDTTAQMITLSDETHITPTLTFNGNAYFRSYAQAHHDGNISDFYSCGGAFVCNDNIATGTVIDGSAPGTTPLRDPLAGTGAAAGTPLGEIDSNWTRTLSTGATAQLTDTDRIFGHDNTITAGASVDHGWTHFSGSSVLSTLPPNFVTPFTSEIVDEPPYDVSPVSVRTQNTYVGVYVLDTFAITDRLALNAGFRFNDAQITLNNTLGEPFSATAAAAGTGGNLNDSRKLQSHQPGCRRDLQDHARYRRLMRVIRKPTARRRRLNFATRAPPQALRVNRQFPRRRSAA